ncbi:MAG: hypothetical protein HON47_03045 [Candidatus Diapherotrites archaeon]|jgi:hypothetical protein|uniref:Uncharacterized protein n=1 Tax=Candidatus Iainarchaeum sp. TaxID=3101447 RepID=A0A8T5GET7_9ARCH|nr:hypothetical protein [Candidatus Diapherotrites archaeon]MBT7240918.1 hypothetical protein [Candidatus Diapherotrites archaeon]
MGISIGLPGFPVEALFGLVAIFLFFAPTILDWAWTSYIGALFFTAITIVIVKYKK